MTGVLKRLFDARVRGVRWVEIVGVMLVAAMVFSVYLAKAAAARVSGQIGELEREIADNGERVRLLRAEVARLEQPARLERLSKQAGLAPIDASRRAEEQALETLKPIAAPPAPAPVVTQDEEPTEASQPVAAEPGQ